MVATPFRQLARVWRRSIQARVVIGTVVLSAVLTLLAGMILLRQVTNGLLDSKEQASITQARSGAVTAQAKLDGAEITDQFEVGPLLKGLVETLAPRDEARDEFSVAIIGPLAPSVGDSGATGGSLFSGDIDPAQSIPASLMDRVTAEPGTWYAYTRVVYDGNRKSVPGIAVGSQVTVTGNGQRYALFYVYPLNEQQQSLFVVRGALITTGALLVVLLGIVAWLVTRQVVTPVRLARRIAERLAAGRLEERMHVRGEDDIARLGISFNQMAGSLQRQIRQLEELSRVQHRFVADVSHELRTPLTTVRMAADVLHDSRIDFDAATARSAELLQAELDRFEGLLTDLLEISRFDAGAAVLDLSDVDLRAVARRVVDSNAALAERRGSVVTVTTAREPCVAEVDVRRIERIVRNLVVNAIEYGAGGDVEVTVAGVGLRRRTDGPRPWRRPSTGRGDLGVQPLLAGGPGARTHPGRHRTRPVDRGRGHGSPLRDPGRLGRAGGRLGLPADAASARGRPARTVTAAADPTRAGAATRRCAVRPLPARPPPRCAVTARPGVPPLRLLVVVAAVLLAATACVSIPESSSVRAGRAVSAQDEQPVSRNKPNGPRPGAGRKEIATGYLNAMLAFPPAPDVVRQFLTPDASADWNPADGLVVYTSSDQPRLSEKAESVTFSARAVGSLDTRGTWTTTPRNERDVTAEFEMIRVFGEWRLRNPLPGTYVDQSYYADYFDPYSLYFFNPSMSILTPDPVHMLTSDSLATSLVNDLLQGPTRALDGAVSTSIPSTARVDVAVSISLTGVAEIPLSDEVLQMSLDDRRLLAAQLVWTLRPLGDIRAIVVTVNGQRVDLGVGTEVSIDAFSGFDPAGLAANRQLYGLTGQGLVSVSATDTTTVTGPILAMSRDARSAAVDPNTPVGAVVSADGSTVTVAGMTTTDTSGTTVWYSGGDAVIKPSWDIHGLLWLVDNRPDGAHLFVVDNGNPHEVYAKGITGRMVHNIAVSRDGVRLAAIVGKDRDRRLVIAVIDRDASNAAELTVRPAQRVVTAGVTETAVSSSAWVSPTSIGALVDDEGGEPTPSEISIDGSPTLASRFPGFLPIKPVALAGGPNEDTPTAIVDKAGALYQQSLTAEWVQVGGAAAIRAPFYPG